MRWLDKLRLRMRSLFRSRRLDNELERELQEHLHRQIDENIEIGMAPEEARMAALQTIGNLTHLKEQCRDERGLNFLDDLRLDLRYAFVTLRRNPGHAMGAIVSLGLGIGAATAVFSAVEGLVLNPYPYSGADRIVVMSQAEGAAPSRRTFLTGDQARLLTQARSLDAVILWDGSWMSVRHLRTMLLKIGTMRRNTSRNSHAISLTTSFAFLSSLRPMKRECRRCPSGVHSVNSNCPTSTGFTQRHSSIFSFVSP
jgi:hypothetical protein